MSENEVTSGFVPPDIDELSQGLPGYEFIDLLACGGMGAVYRARQTSLDRMVAIKILPPELAVDKTFRKSFEAEGKAMAKVSHSNLVGVFNLGEVSDMLYLVMEFVEGSTLYQSKGDSAIDPETAVTLIRSVSAGLAEAHRNDLVHRDIKPANIFINQDLVPKLGDFGLAVPDSDIESGLMMGTPAYLAPEVMENPSSASFASDTYALGVILYEMLTGSSIEQGDVMDLNRVPKLGDLPNTVRKSLNPKPLLRYQDAAALESDLKNWLSKPKVANLAVNSAGRVPTPRMASVATEESGGGGGLLFPLVALVVIVGVAWHFLGGESDSKEVSDDTSSPPSVVEPDEAKDSPPVVDTPTLKSLEELRMTQQAAIQELSSRIAEGRTENRLEFFKAAGEEGESLYKLLPATLADMPRYFLPDEVEISEELFDHLQEFAESRQNASDEKFHQEMSTLHRESLRALRASKAEFPPEVGYTWEGWVEWLGHSPISMMHTSLAGSWSFSSGEGEFEFLHSATGKSVLLIDGEPAEGEVWIDLSESGEVSLAFTGESVFNFPWKLRWRATRLEGVDARGEKRVLRLGRFNFADLVKKSVAPEEMTEAQPKGVQPAADMFEDAQVVALTSNYHKALLEKIEPLESGYLRVLKTFLESYQEKDDELAVRQIEAEVERVAATNWRQGFMQLSFFKAPGELPSDVRRKQELFGSEFKKRYVALQRTYRLSLERMLRDRKARRDANLGDVEKALKNLEIPEGSVVARFVKIVSLEDVELRGASIAMMDILDTNGNKLPIEKFSNVKASTFEEREPDGSLSTPECAIDGNPNSFWQTAWKKGLAGFPHWLSFDLGGEHIISGFILTPRIFRVNRYSDFTNWRFYVSDDGRKWKEVAAGKFPKGNQPNEYRGFKEIE